MLNSVSADCSVKDFETDIGLHYEIADKVRADAHLIGSETARLGIELFTEEVPPEEASDFVRPLAKSDDVRPVWVISDAKGKLKGLMHVYRRSCYCRDVIALVANRTPGDYVNYLKERNYNILTAGDESVDFRDALDKLAMYYNVKSVLTESGGGLTSHLLREGLVDEVHLVISPVIVGKAATSLFRYLDSKVNLELIRSERIRGNHMLVVYRVLSSLNSLTSTHLGGESQHV